VSELVGSFALFLMPERIRIYYAIYSQRYFSVLKVLNNLQSIARAVLQAEAEAILQAAEILDDRFDACVNLILQTPGRVVVTGVGKSAIVAQKIVATLNSTGTPALFMHAADAIHGDLGMVQTNDVVVCVSKSGNTPEIKVLVPLLRRADVKLIALICNVDSFLARHADCLLYAPCTREADPLDLAPTTSTTVSLAMGDALAVALLNARGFTRQDFARFHPGGSLGKKLYLKVSDLFPHNACPVVRPETSVPQAILEISSKRLGATAVVDGTDTLVGIITDGDVRRMLAKYNFAHLDELLARDIMNPSPVCIGPDEYAVQAIDLMEARDISQVLVVDNGRLLGFVHLHDLLREGLV
jgi:arabinose-5-phosphate isomerase